MKKLKMFKNISLLLMGCLFVLAAIIPSGTFSFFSSNKTTYSTLAIGSCKQTVNSDVNFTLNDLYPGQEPQKMNIDLQNEGTLVINQLELTAGIEVKDKSGNILTEEQAGDFLSQFNVEIVSNNESIKSMKLSELILGIDLTKIEQLNVTEGLNVGESLNIELQFIFNEESEKQAQFEEWSISTKFFIEGIC